MNPISNMEHLQYPVGKFTYQKEADASSFEQWKSTINKFPEAVQRLVDQMTDSHLHTPYRPGGWTAKQVIHHVSDSHSHALIRFKWSLTEDKPTIKPYLESKYALLMDYTLPVQSALMILNGVHLKWGFIMDNMSDDDWQKGYFHPESGKFFSLHNALALYDWHCRHHFAHLEICAGKR